MAVLKNPWFGSRVLSKFMENPARRNFIKFLFDL